MNAFWKVLVLSVPFFCTYGASSEDELAIQGTAVTPGAYQPDQALPGCHAEKLAKDLVAACAKQYGESSEPIDWQAATLSQAICKGEEPIAGQDTTYSVFGDVQPCPGSHGELSSKWVCEVKINTQYQVEVIYIYPVTCSG